MGNQSRARELARKMSFLRAILHLPKNSKQFFFSTEITEFREPVGCLPTDTSCKLEPGLTPACSIAKALWIPVCYPSLTDQKQGVA